MVYELVKRLEDSVLTALKTYSNVHRGSGQFSQVTTHLYDKSREVVLEYLGLSPDKWDVVFATPISLEKLMTVLPGGSFRVLSSEEAGLPLGVRIVVVRKKALPAGAPPYTGGGTTRLIGRDWVLWAKSPGRFEPGTPAVINIITFIRYLQLCKDNSLDYKTVSAEMLNQKAGEVIPDPWSELQGEALLKELTIGWIGKYTRVVTREGMRPYIHLDNGASTLTFPPVWDAFRQTWFQEKDKNAQIPADVRQTIAAWLNVPLDDYEVIFTGNTTEAANLLAENFANNKEPGEVPRVLTTLLEHSSNDLPWRPFSKGSPLRLPVDEQGFIHTAELEKWLKAYNADQRHGNERIRMVAVTGASNVMGSCQDLEEIGRVVHSYGARLVVDAAQLVAHRKVDVAAIDADAWMFSAHKVYAPFGCGVLVVKKEFQYLSETRKERIRQLGEENKAGIAAFGKAIGLLQRVGYELIIEREKELTIRLLLGLHALPDMRVYGVHGVGSPRFDQKAGVIPFASKKVMSNKVANRMAEQSGIGIRFGCHCAHLMVKHLVGIKPGLEKIQRLIVILFPGLKLPGVARVSLGVQNTREEVDMFLKELAIATSKRGNELAQKQHTENEVSGNVNRTVYKQQLKFYMEEIGDKVFGFDQ